MGMQRLLVDVSDMVDGLAMVSPAREEEAVMGMDPVQGNVLVMQTMEGEVMGMEAMGEEMMGMEVEAMVEAMEAMEAMVGETMTSTFGREGAFAQFIAEGRSLMQSCIKRSAHL